MVRSNRESGFGRHDVMLIPKNQGSKAYVPESVDYVASLGYNDETDCEEMKWESILILEMMNSTMQ